MRLGDDHFRVVTGGAHGMADRQWFTDHLVDGATLTDRTDEISTIGLWGPRARDILASLTDADVSDEGFGFLTCREIQVGGATVLASRISYVGELGWELYVSMADAAQVWEALLDTGDTHGTVPVGIGVYGTTGRIEKGYRAYGYELDGERTIVEAGHAAAQGEGRRLHRPGGLPGPAGGSVVFWAEDGALHADRRGPHLGVGCQALHARR